MKYYINIKQFPKHWFSGKEGQWSLKEGKQYPLQSLQPPAFIVFQATVQRGRNQVEPSHLSELRTQSWKSREVQGN